MHKALGSFPHHAKKKKKKVKRRRKVTWIKGRDHVFTQYHPSSKDLEAQQTCLEQIVSGLLDVVVMNIGIIFHNTNLKKLGLIV
jgi:hypothetical protein